VKQALVGVIARMEAGIDFAEDDVAPASSAAMAGEVRSGITALEPLLAGYAYGRLLREGMRVTIAGRPNVGKSSLFNALLAAERAIVTEIPGTTRDLVGETTSIGGIPVHLVDTAGVRETNDVVERIGVGRTLEAVGEADVVLFVVDASAGMTQEDCGVLARLGDCFRITVANKEDLGRRADARLCELEPWYVSAKHGTGIEDLKEAIVSALGGRVDVATEGVLTNARHHDALQRTVDALGAAESGLHAGTPDEMVLLDLYSALSALNELTGETTTEDILGEIFSTFCIGK
jgi:tRNA modification GTPase